MQYPQDPAALSHLEPVVAHELRVALTSYRTPTAAKARLLAHLAKAESEIKAALGIASQAHLPAVLRRIPAAEVPALTTNASNAERKVSDLGQSATNYNFDAPVNGGEA